MRNEWQWHQHVLRYSFIASNYDHLITSNLGHKSVLFLDYACSRAPAVHDTDCASQEHTYWTSHRIYKRKFWIHYIVISSSEKNTFKIIITISNTGRQMSRIPPRELTLHVCVCVRQDTIKYEGKSDPHPPPPKINFRLLPD